MKPIETAARQVGHLLDMEQESGVEKYRFSKQRTIEIGEEDVAYPRLFDLSVSFERYQNNGLARNRAELYLRKEEYEKFLFLLIRHKHSLPTDYRQWQEEKASVVCMHLEAIEPPEFFAARLAETFQGFTD
ncbi:hypothetical protein [Planococcus alpniumensis]|uniref:hypothetical protein n=1 Tax=Planococcus alpniumensis TaxID=2708345 RepID=UPI001B8AD4AB|nr:hypothetical protein [Planococcus sp. MSAK28401]